MKTSQEGKHASMLQTPNIYINELHRTSSTSTYKTLSCTSWNSSLTNPSSKNSPIY